MKRTRNLGIAVAMALALTAFVGVSSASANSFMNSVAPGKWTGSLTGKNHVLSLWGETFTCGKVAFSGETKTITLNDVTVTPELNSCSHNGFSVGWTMNGCKFRFRPGAGPALTGLVDITGCASPMSNNTSGCVTEIGNQNGLGTVTYTNSGTGVITAKANLSSITFTRGGVSCVGPKGTFSNGTYTGEWTVKGSNPEGVPAWTEVESTSPPPLSLFNLQEVPATLSASSTGVAQRITSIAGMELSCESFTLNGSSSSLSSATVTLHPTYKTCTVGGEAVGDNWLGSSCDYVINANGKFDLAGTEDCTNGKLTISRPGCSVQFPPQAGLSGVAYANQGSGRLRTITLSGTVTNLKYTSAGSSCSKYGEYTDGTIVMSGKLSATNSSGAAQGIWVE